MLARTRCAPRSWWGTIYEFICFESSQNIIITYHEPPNQLPFVPDQVFPTSGCCQLGAARLFTSCCRSSSGGNSTREPAWNPNKCGEFSHDVDFISWKDRIPCFLVKRSWPFCLVTMVLIIWSLFESCCVYPFCSTKCWTIILLLQIGLQCFFDFTMSWVTTGKNGIWQNELNVRCNDIMTRKTWDLSPNMINGVVLLRKA